MCHQRTDPFHLQGADETMSSAAQQQNHQKIYQMLKPLGFLDEAVGLQVEFETLYGFININAV